MSSILLITDAWTPQINGVVTTLTNVVKKCRELGHTVTVFSANNCKRRVPVYFYPEIVLGIPCGVLGVVGHNSVDLRSPSISNQQYATHLSPSIIPDRPLYQLNCTI